MTEIQKKIRALILIKFNEATVQFTGEGCQTLMTIVHPLFENQTRIQRQQAVLSLLKDLFASGELHALSIKALTPNEASHG